MGKEEDSNKKELKKQLDLNKATFEEMDCFIKFSDNSHEKKGIQVTEVPLYISLNDVVAEWNEDDTYLLDPPRYPGSIPHEEINNAITPFELFPPHLLSLFEQKEPGHPIQDPKDSEEDLQVKDVGSPEKEQIPKDNVKSEIVSSELIEDSKNISNLEITPDEDLGFESSLVMEKPELNESIPSVFFEEKEIDWYEKHKRKIIGLTSAAVGIALTSAIGIALTSAIGGGAILYKLDSNNIRVQQEIQETSLLEEITNNSIEEEKLLEEIVSESTNPVIEEEKAIMYKDGFLKMDPSNGFCITTYAAAIDIEGIDALVAMSAEKQLTVLQEYNDLSSYRESQLKSIFGLTLSIIESNADKIENADATLESLTDPTKNVIEEGVPLIIEYPVKPFTVDNGNIAVNFVIPNLGASQYIATSNGEGNIHTLATKSASEQVSVIEGYSSETVQEYDYTDMGLVLSETKNFINANLDKVQNVNLDVMQDGTNNVINLGQRLIFNLDREPDDKVPISISKDFVEPTLEVPKDSPKPLEENIIDEAQVESNTVIDEAQSGSNAIIDNSLDYIVSVTSRNPDNDITSLFEDVGKPVDPISTDELMSEYIMMRDIEEKTSSLGQITAEDIALEIARSYNLGEGFNVTLYSKNDRVKLADQLAVSNNAAIKGTDSYLTMNNIVQLINEGADSNDHVSLCKVRQMTRNRHGKTRIDTILENIEERRQRVQSSYFSGKSVKEIAKEECVSISTTYRDINSLTNTKHL